MVSLTASLNSLFDGTYQTRVMRALGDTTATVRIAGGNDSDPVITGKPMGSWYDGQDNVADAATPAAARRDTITLSPLAQRKIDELNIALDMMTGINGQGTKPRKNGAAAGAAQSPGSPAAPPLPPQADDQAQSSPPGDPTAIINQTVSTVRDLLRRMDAPGAIYTQEFADAGIREHLANVSAPVPKEYEAIKAAYDNKTLIIMKPDQVATNDAATTYTSRGAWTSGNVNFDASKLDPSYNYASVSVMLGQYVMAWPKTAADAPQSR